MSNENKNKVYIVSGRDKQFLDENFNIPSIGLIAEHGHYIKDTNDKWLQPFSLESKWKQNFLPIFQDFCDRTPGTFGRKITV